MTYNYSISNKVLIKVQNHNLYEIKNEQNIIFHIKAFSIHNWLLQFGLSWKKDVKIIRKIFVSVFGHVCTFQES